MKHALGLALLALSGNASAQSITLTDDSGRPITIGSGEVYGAGLAVTKLQPAQIAASLKGLCTPDPDGAYARAANSAFELGESEVVLPAVGKVAEARVKTWSGPSATLSTWNGDDVPFKGRPMAINSRAYATTGPYGPFHASGGQCNVVIAVSSFADVAPIAAAISDAFGVQPAKLVVKNTFADGYWTTAEGLRVNMTAPSIKSATQPVHLSVQALAAKGK